MVEAVAAGATGFLQKYSGKEQLLDTVREVADGKYRIPSNVLRSVFAGIRGTAEQKTTDGPKSLTQRDREILDALCPGPFLRGDSRGEEYPAVDHKKRHIQHSGQARYRYQAGACGVGGS